MPKIKKGEEVTKEFMFTIQFAVIENAIDASQHDFIISEDDKWVTIKATAIIGNRMMNGYYIPYSELKKSVNAWNGTFHDISHLGTSYPDTVPPFRRENLEYVVGYQSDTKADDATKELNMTVKISKQSKKYPEWRSFIDICKAAHKIPNVSVSLNAKAKEMRASDLCDEDKGECGLDSSNDKKSIICLCDIEPKALTTCLKGACDEKRGCGLAQHNETQVDQTCDCGNETCVSGANDKNDEDAKKLASVKEQIKKLKEE